MLESARTHAELHGIDQTFSGAILGGLGGVLFSPGRGLLVYSPIVTVSFLGAAFVWRSTRVERWLLVIPVIGSFSRGANLAVWWGGHSFGPRYAADVVIPLALLAGAACARQAWSARSLWLTAFTTLLLLWSVSVQVIGMFFHPNGDWNTTPANVDTAHSRLWDWRDAQIVRGDQGWSFRGAPRTVEGRHHSMS